MINRRVSNQVKIGNILMGGNAPVSVQSMLNAPSYDISANVSQAQRLEAAGCEIIRVAVPDLSSVNLIDALKNGDFL